MKDMLISFAFAAACFLAVYTVSAGFASFMFWDVSLFNVENWYSLWRGVLGVVGVFVMWCAFMFSLDDLAYKSKYREVKQDLKAEQELRKIEMSVLRERNMYESAYRCRHFTL